MTENTSTHWTILHVLPKFELRTALALTLRGGECYVPAKPMSRRVSPRTKRKANVEHPLIPRIVFVRLGSLGACAHALRIVGVVSVARGASGAAVAISAAEIERFKVAHQKWLNSAQGEDLQRPKRPRFTKMTSAGLEKLRRDLFGE